MMPAKKKRQYVVGKGKHTKYRQAYESGKIMNRLDKAMRQSGHGSSIGQSKKKKRQ